MRNPPLPSSIFTPKTLALRIGGQMAIALCLSALTGCNAWSNDGVEATVVFSGKDSAAEPSEVRVIVGSDKFYFGQLTAGGEDKVTLKPRPEDDRQLTLLFTLNGEQKSWDGPKFAMGVGYRIIMTIDPLGKVVDRHCILPCQLD